MMNTTPAPAPSHRIAAIRERNHGGPAENWAECECGERVEATTPALLAWQFAEHRRQVAAEPRR
jgi:hypothetical protein